MTVYDFTLKFRLQQAEDNAERHVEALAANGCDDALIGIGKLGSIALNFTRDAPDAATAVTTAIADVEQSIPDITLIEASPDLVGMTDIAEVYGASRQYVRKLITTRPHAFPAPIHEGNPTLWHLADVLDCMATHKPKCVDQTVIEVARVNMQVNAYRSFAKASRDKKMDSLFPALPSNYGQTRATEA